MATIASISIPARYLKDYEYFRKISFARKDKSNSETWIKAMLEYNKHNPIGPSSQITDFVGNDPMVLPPISLYTDIKQFRTIINSADIEKLVNLRNKIKTLENMITLELQERVDGVVDWDHYKKTEKENRELQEIKIQKSESYTGNMIITEPTIGISQISSQVIQKRSLNEFFS